MTRLSQYFSGVAVKKLRPVEADMAVSNQHEINGVRGMVKIFGRDKIEMRGSYLYMGDDENEIISESGSFTWYDSRGNQSHRSAEYRLYFQGNGVTEQAAPGDLLVVGKKSDGSVLFLVVKEGSTYERQTLWLFGITDENTTFKAKEIEGEANRTLGFAERTILETLGVEVEPETTDWLEMILERFGTTFPSTRVFSAFARGTCDIVSSLDDPDQALLAWVDREELMFKTLERHIVQERIQIGFHEVDDFIRFSLSVHNRRKSRAGYALENHLEQVLIDYKVTYSREKVTENKSKPDFIFPGIEQYHDPSFSTSNLTMLGSKSTCKDRWRQVLAEAERIDKKHLFTLEPGISTNQTNEMHAKNLLLVLPNSLHETYLTEQQNWLMNFSEFIQLVQNRQPTKFVTTLF